MFSRFYFLGLKRLHLVRRAIVSLNELKQEIPVQLELQFDAWCTF